MQIGSVKIGSSQMSKPAPAKYRNFSNAMIIFILPGLAALISGWGFSQAAVNHWLLSLTFAGSAIKALGTFMGNGQYYTTDQKSADNQDVVQKDQAADQAAEEKK
jgi:hypothetical protein